MNLTPQETLGRWLLRVLLSNNGRATKAQALRLIEKRFGQALTVDDRLLQESVNEEKWENRTAWERDRLVKAGLLQATSKSGRGVWALTDAGLEAAKPLEKGTR